MCKNLRDYPGVYVKSSVPKEKPSECVYVKSSVPKEKPSESKLLNLIKTDQ